MCVCVRVRRSVEQEKEWVDDTELIRSDNVQNKYMFVFVFALSHANMMPHSTFNIPP